jgi:uncharacterized protein (TIGR02246 family)
MQPSESPEAVIRNIVRSEVDAWNAGDARAYSRHFATEGNLTNIYGRTLRGRAEFEASHARIFAGFFRGSVMTASERRLRLVTWDVAIVELDIEVRNVGEMPPGITPGADGVLRTHLLQVFVQREGAWWIEAYHNVACI